MQGWAGKAAGTVPGTIQATWWSPWLANFRWVVLHGQLEMRACSSAPVSVTVTQRRGHRSPFTVQSNPNYGLRWEGVDGGKGGKKRGRREGKCWGSKHIACSMQRAEWHAIKVIEPHNFALQLAGCGSQTCGTQNVLPGSVGR
eukprot:356865-Chlamydomonas_euryale.AAC.3